MRHITDDQGAIVPLEFNSEEKNECANSSPFGVVTTHVPAPRVEGELNVHVESLRVDGIDIDLRGGCATKEPMSVHATGRPYYVADGYQGSAYAFFFENDPSSRRATTNEEPRPQNLFTTPFFNPAAGGLLSGTVTPPPFANCTTRSGDEVSHLLTASISNAPTTVTLRSTGLNPVSGISVGAFPALDIPTSAPESP